MNDIKGKPIIVNGSMTPWYKFAKSLIGTKEIVGTGSNVTISEMFEYTDMGRQPDSVPWCSAFVNFCLYRTGYKGSFSAAARSFTWGSFKKIDFKEGCIVVIPRGDDPGKGHVGFAVSYKSIGPVHIVKILGGNQNDAVNISTYYRKPIGFYWPEKIKE